MTFKKWLEMLSIAFTIAVASKYFAILAMPSATIADLAALVMLAWGSISINQLIKAKE